ncbi:MAG: hypothetical protein V1834_02425, partial [Candidatus Micrarchaeota archaeon]
APILTELSAITGEAGSEQTISFYLANPADEGLTYRIEPSSEHALFEPSSKSYYLEASSSKKLSFNLLLGTLPEDGEAEYSVTACCNNGFDDSTCKTVTGLLYFSVAGPISGPRSILVVALEFGFWLLIAVIIFFIVKRLTGKSKVSK